MDSGRPGIPKLMALLGRAALHAGQIQPEWTDIVRRVLLLLEVDLPSIGPMMRAGAEDPAGEAPAATPAILWLQMTRVLVSLPPGPETRTLATRLGRALGVDPDKVEAFVCELEAADGPASPELVLREAQLARKLAAGSPDDLARWRAMAEACNQAVRFLAPRHDWPAVHTVEGWLREIPSGFESATAGPRASALATIGIFALQARAQPELDTARAELAGLVDRSGELVARREYGCLLGCLVETALENGFPDVSDALEAASLLQAMLVRDGGDRELLLMFARSSNHVQILFFAARDVSGHLGLLDVIREAAKKHPGDEEIAFELAKGVINITLLRVDVVNRSTARRDPLIMGLERTLEVLESLAPGSPRLADARGRFERALPGEEDP